MKNMRNQINIINARERMTLHIIFHACFSCCSFNLYALPYVIFFKQLIAVVAIKSQINKYEKIVFSSLHISIITCSREPTSLLALSALSHIFRDFMFMLMIFEKKKNLLWFHILAMSMFELLFYVDHCWFFPQSQWERENTKLPRMKSKRKKSIYCVKHYIVARVGVYCILHWRRSRSSSSRWK